MARTSIENLEKVLTTRLGLRQPRFHIEKLPGGKLSGSIVSDTFKGKDDLKRQRQIWDALDAEFGKEATAIVGTLLAYTTEEWDVPLTGLRQTKPKSKTR